MVASVVYEDVNEGFDFESGGNLFAGKKFWVAQRVPTRNHLLDEIKANGGEIVLLEKKADYMIADHFRRDCPPGSISYEFVTKSIKNGELCDPKDHPAGPPVGEAREPGAIHQPTKSGRTPYTAEEDKILYKWARDAELSGSPVSGNEIYKQLEQKYPQHTWQSWRDRYLKQLRNRPPSAFDLPNDAPPSPSSDQANKRTPPDSSSSKPTKQHTSKREQGPSAKEASAKKKANSKNEYSVNELEELFSTDEWLELYAFADLINSLEMSDEYDAAWEKWAEEQGKQTAVQWRQYFEKVVRPQWLIDPVSKREKIKRKVEKKHDEENQIQSQSISQPFSQSVKPEEEAAQSTVPVEGDTPVQTPGLNDERFEELINSEHNNKVPSAYKFFAREKKQETLNAHPGRGYTALHIVLIQQWSSLSTEEKAPYLAMDKKATAHVSEETENFTKIAQAPKRSPSPEAQHEPLKLDVEKHDQFIKRSREDDETEERDEEIVSPRPIKRRKSGSITPTKDNTLEVPIEETGTQQQPLEISSSANSQDTIESELIKEQARPDIPDSAEDDEATMVELDRQSAEKEVESIESDEFLDIDHLHQSPGYESGSEDDLRSSTPTPRATRQKVSNFDTQAILSSPIQDGFPRSLGLAQEANFQQELLFSSPQMPESDASTTLSMEEFRRSLQEENADEVTYSQYPPQPLRLSSSPAPSTTSTSSGDPDPPLNAEEINEFYDEQNAQGFPNDFISAALKRTGLRPELAVKVLDAWKQGKPLPSERGIWSKENDVAVESGDGYELAKLAKKHTLDGWGGVTERLVFLEGYRSR
ncbi:hypothetical protein COCMIDRAFT_99119 [Bipolaris oryzae ATCC 44560]|uniref:DNA-binding protein RAP1 n=1 Tax=Bipolaris oryzae ATCC 44560 TaxID=930090 RepID=W6Z2Y4_COCMI|nr:uncharacterized protein COCMIDRAFT_99119 [Bipolaris oryzae ATCC 44560]EUC44078.1 hypothetical protein COCMIDRAFT_99119 [Bipolaris oryzae ATCC 44560]